MTNVNSVSKPVGLLDRLPSEILVHVIEHIFVPWSAMVSLSCQLCPIPNISILRTCRFFYVEGTKTLKSSFTGEFIRHDSSGSMIFPDLEIRRWSSWIKENTTILHIWDVSFAKWYIPRYWQSYPALERFKVTVIPEQTYNDPANEMPDYALRVQSCEQRMQLYKRSCYEHVMYLFAELCSGIYKDMMKHEREKWPSVEFHFTDCRCHPLRQIIFSIESIETDVDLEVIISASFRTTIYQLDRRTNTKSFISSAVLTSMSLLDQHGEPSRLEIMTITPRSSTERFVSLSLSSW